MSIPVEVADLPRAVLDFGAAYLLTASADGRVKAVSVVPVLADGRFHLVAPGRGSCANATAHPSVTLLWPPLTAGAMSLLVDGEAVVDGDDVHVSPTSAVLHKAATPPGT
jgi:hypothetical protein